MSHLNVSTYDKTGKKIDLEQIILPDDLSEKILRLVNKEIIPGSVLNGTN